MSDKHWKTCERRIAKLLGGRRVLVSGRARGDAPDIAHEHLAVEVKDRASPPKWLREAMQQAEASATADQLPIVVLHQAGQRYDESYVMLRLGAFVASGIWRKDMG